jgi:futalosine hydrolase
MKILLVAATRFEIEPLLSRFAGSKNPDQLILPDFTVEVLVTGVGMVATAFALGKQLALNNYDLAINVGIAGSFAFDIELGEVVLVTEDVFAEQGAEDNEDFLSLVDLGFGEITQYSHQSIQKGEQTNLNLAMPEQIRKVKAITVNKVHGNEFSIAKTLSRFKAEVESMEGAAFFYACNQSQTPCIQLRAISNYVEPRDKERWKVDLAIKNLNEFLINFLLPK